MPVMMDDHNITLSTIHLVPIQNSDNSKKITKVQNLSGDRWNLVKLLFLYILQGVPLGFSDAFPILLKSQQFSYYDQVMYIKRQIFNVRVFLINNIIILMNVSFIV